MGVYFLRSKNNCSLFANFENPKNAFLQQIVFEKACNHYFSAGNGVLRNDRFCALCARFFGKH